MTRRMKQLQAYKRLLFPSPAEKKFIEVMGRWFFVWWGVKRELPVGGYWLDFAVPRRRVGIEIDGAKYHTNVVADWERDQRLLKRGWTIMRIPARDLWREPQKVRAKVLKELRGY